MSECKGTEAVATKIDEEMMEHIDNQADKLDVTRAECFRLILDDYRSATEEGVTCSCGETFRLRLHT